jgi:hypothetical protein
MSRAILNVSTPKYQRGQKRLRADMLQHSAGAAILTWYDKLPPHSPTHQECNYAFKAWAIEHARSIGHTRILWCDASIRPLRSVEPLWQLIESQGYWFSANGYKNSQWTAKNTLPLLGVTAEENETIEHLATTAFGLDLRSDIGHEFADEFLRLAKNGSFHGPWVGGIGVQHRHDQTAASVIAHRLGMKLTPPPQWFAYRGGETAETVLLADGIC